MGLTAIANQDTWLKDDWKLQASQLSPEDKEFIKKGTEVKFISFNEACLERQEESLNGHASLVLADNLDNMFLFVKHWDFPWDKPTKPIEGKLPEWHEIDWCDFEAPVSKYFTVGEVCLYQVERIPTEDKIKQNIITYARKKDSIREWLGCGILLTSWYRPWHVNRRIGSRAPNHPNGWASDWYPAIGDVLHIQKRFEREWFNTKKWRGGFGLGAPKGFIHTDAGNYRSWNY